MSKGAATTFCPKGDCSPMYNGLFTFFSLRFRAGAYLESFCINGQFQLLGNHFSASFDASEFCWQIGLNFLQHLRPYLIQSIFLQLIFLMQSHGFLQLIIYFSFTLSLKLFLMQFHERGSVLVGKNPSCLQWRLLNPHVSLKTSKIIKCNQKYLSVTLIVFFEFFARFSTQVGRNRNACWKLEWPWESDHSGERALFFILLLSPHVCINNNNPIQISVAPAGFAIASASWDQTVLLISFCD